MVKDATHEAVPILRADYEALIAALRAVDRLSLVILTAVSKDQPDYHDAVAAAILATRIALAKATTP